MRCRSITDRWRCATIPGDLADSNKGIFREARRRVKVRAALRNGAGRKDFPFLRQILPLVRIDEFPQPDLVTGSLIRHVLGIAEFFFKPLVQLLEYFHRA